MGGGVAGALYSPQRTSVHSIRSRCFPHWDIFIIKACQPSPATPPLILGVGEGGCGRLLGYAATIGVPEAKKEILSLSPEDMGRDIFELSNPLVWWCEKNREELFALPHPPL